MERVNKPGVMKVRDWASEMTPTKAALKAATVDQNRYEVWSEYDGCPMRRLVKGTRDECLEYIRRRVRAGADINTLGLMGPDGRACSYAL